MARGLVLGNIKALQRMISQYAVAGTTGGLVVGSDHAAEALMGFFPNSVTEGLTSARWAVSPSVVFGRWLRHSVVTRF